MDRHPYHLERIGHRRQAADQATADFHKAIVEANADGWSTREIAAATGSISHSRVYQIINQARKSTATAAQES